MRRRATRVLTGAQAACGVLTIVGARSLAGRVDHAPRWLPPVIAVLGARQVAQAALVHTVDDPLVLRAGAVVDALHAVSLVPVVAGSPRLRVLAAVSLCSAVAGSVAGFVFAD